MPTLITELVPWGESSYLYTWNPAENLDINISTVKHIECIIFNNKKEIMIIHEYGRWSIPGGAPEKDESYETAIKREVKEETNALVNDLKLIGYFKIENQTVKENPFYHVVYGSTFIEQLPRETDPESGVILETKFIPALDATKYVKWGKTGEAMFNRAFEIYNGNLLIL